MIRFIILLVVTLTAVSARSNMIFKKIDVRVGAVGSDDDIRIKICDASKCCTTKELYHTFGSEWKANNLETWDGGDLGNCSKILFDDNLSKVSVSILKELRKKDALDVTSMALTAQVGSELQKFNCASYKFTARDQIKSNDCLNEKTSPKPVTNKRPSLTPQLSTGAPNLQVEKILVHVGPDGTNEDISIKICDSTKCCTTATLYHRLSSEWVKNKLETWDSKRKLGNCSTVLFASGSPSLQVSVINTSSKKKDPLEITDLVVEASPTSDKKKVEKFICGSYKLSTGEGIKSNRCPKITIGPSNLQVKKIHVQMGPDGTNEDVSVKICDALKVCCTTDTLYHRLSSEWVKNKNETWDSKLGNCSKVLLVSGSPRLDVTVIKTNKKKDPLEITNIVIEASPTSDKKIVEKYKCGSYKLGATDTSKTGFCMNENLYNQEKFKVNNVVVQMGNDGTNDDVSLEICNAASVLTCCNTGKLSSFGDDWSKGDKETWQNKNLGPCKEKKFDACKGFDVAVKKKSGKDSLKISNITLEVADESNPKDVKKFVCSDYTIGNTDPVKRKTCTLDSRSSLSCPKSPPANTKQNPSLTKYPSSGSLSSGSENVILKEFGIQIGQDGTKDSVYAKVCTEDKKVCCVTPILKKSLGNNWQRRGNETWSGSSLGLCNNKEFPTKTTTTVSNLLESKLILTLEKSGTRDGLKLENFNFEAISAIGSSKRRFKCGKVVVIGTSVTAECVAQFPQTFVNIPITRSLSTNSEQVVLKEFGVQVGKDGTRDSLYAKVCTEDKKVCCVTPILKKSLGNNWLRNGNETWSGSSLGLCNNKEFPTKTTTTVSNLLESKLILTLEKSGTRDGLKLENFNFEAISAIGSSKRRFKCGKIQFVGTSTTQECVAQFPQTFARSQSAPCLRSGRNCDPKPSTPTNYKPFRSTSG